MTVPAKLPSNQAYQLVQIFRREERHRCGDELFEELIELAEGLGCDAKTFGRCVPSRVAAIITTLVKRGHAGRVEAFLDRHSRERAASEARYVAQSWARLGAELAELDPQRLDELLAALRDIVDATRVLRSRPRVRGAA